ncbi:protein NO VEIN domain-containing protein [Rhodococcus sp. C26F]
MFVSHSDFSDIAPMQYDQGYEWLREVGLLGKGDPASPAAHRIFDAAVLHGQPFWLRDADDLIGSPDDLPEDATQAARTLNIDAEEAFSRISSIWRKVDTEERARIGSAGEAALLELLRSTTSARIEHVAAWSDAHGYDISATAPEYELHLEVKSTNRRGRTQFFLSRNEYEVMRRDPRWRLVSVRLDEELKIINIGVVSNSFIKATAPLDHNPLARWDSVRLIVPDVQIEEGLQELASLALSDAPKERRRLILGTENE